MVSVRGKMVARLAGYAAVLGAAGSVPVTVGVFAEATSAQTLMAQTATTQTAPAAIVQPSVVDATSPNETADPTIYQAPAPATEEATTAAVDQAELTCMAKVVHHEAGSEPRAGQLAVAQLIVKRMKSGRFPASACGVANQRGQFFDTASYHPSHDDARWTSAVAVSLEAIAGNSGEVAPGAMFFRSAAGSPSSFFRSRERVATIGHQVFYR